MTSKNIYSKVFKTHLRDDDHEVRPENGKNIFLEPTCNGQEENGVL